MSATEFFAFSSTHRRVYAGPLGPYIDEFTDRLRQAGYSAGSIRTKIRVVASLSRWLRHHDRDLLEVDGYLLKRFRAFRKRTGCYVADDAAALRDLEAFLGSKGLVDGPPKQPKILSEPEREVEDFRRYLAQDRGLSAATVRGYAPVISRFMRECFAEGPFQPEQLTSTDVTGFVQRHAHETSHSRAQQMVKALRAFLRYLYHHARIGTDLVGSVPKVASWRFSSVPSFLSPDQLEQVLEQCDRTTARGRRDYAMLLLLARLGLRAAEVAGLTLADIDWAQGRLAIRNKGGRWTHMPLTHEVGEAIAAYLTDGRPSSTDDHVFIRQIAPRIGFASSSAVTWVAAHALRRAGIECERKGAHVFRHTLATEMLRQGASLVEIGQLLRHQHPDTTRLYAKVDLAALRELALVWPGELR